MTRKENEKRPSKQAEAVLNDKDFQGKVGRLLRGSIEMNRKAKEKQSKASRDRK